MEIEEQNALNVLEIRKKTGEIGLIKRQEGWEDNAESVNQVKELTNMIQLLKKSTTKNTLKKEITNLQIMESMNATKKIREDIMRKIRSKENRDTLGNWQPRQKSSSRTTCWNSKTSSLKSTCRSRNG